MSKHTKNIISVPRVCIGVLTKCVFRNVFTPRGKSSLLQEQILFFRVQICFPFRAEPIRKKFLSRKANGKSQKLLYFIKMTEERGTVSSNLNVFGYTTVLYRLFCK